MEMRKRSLSAIVVVMLSIFLLAPVVPAAQAETFPDAYTQIVNHQISVQHDGAPTYFAGGRFYTGPNGLEIRFTDSGTSLVVKLVLTLGLLTSDSEISGAASILGGAGTSKYSSARA
jgi:hypothetical protein